MTSSYESEDPIDRLEQKCLGCESSGACLGNSPADREASLKRAMLALRQNAGAKTPLVLCGEHPIMRGALHALLDTRAEFLVAIEAAICPHVIRFFADLEVKLVVADLDLSDASTRGLKALQLLLASDGDEDPDDSMLQVLVLTAEPDPAACRHAFEIGVRGLVLKHRTLEDLFGAIKRVSRGDSWLEGPALEKLLRQNGPSKNNCSEQSRISLLTTRERQIIEVGAKGATNLEIGKQLYISGATVRHHLCAIFEKLGVATRGELIVYAYRHHLADRRILDQH